MARKMVGQSTARPDAASAWRHIVFPAPDGVLPAIGHARGRVWTWARAVSRSSSLTRLSPRSHAPSLGVQARRSSRGQFPADLRRIRHLSRALLAWTSGNDRALPGRVEMETRRLAFVCCCCAWAAQVTCDPRASSAAPTRGGGAVSVNKCRYIYICFSYIYS